MLSPKQGEIFQKTKNSLIDKELKPIKLVFAENLTIKSDIDQGDEQINLKESLP